MSEQPVVGIRREDKHQWEARVPLTPEAVKTLVADGIRVLVQPSPIRTFTDDAYRSAGATVVEDLSPADVVLAVKEIPLPMLRQDGAYVFFSHTIKGQPHNMPLLAKMMALGCTLFDYERIVDDQGRRLVFFGRHAGLAGMIDTLAVHGRRVADSPFAGIRLAHEYPDLDAAKAAIRACAAPAAPFVVGFAGYGNVSQGAQQIYDLLQPAELRPDALPATTPGFVKVVFKEEDLVVREDGGFELQEYYDHPDRYRSTFAQHAPHLTVLINAIYWTEAYPRLLTKDFLRTANLKLEVIGDISCDIDGSVECTVKATTPGAPAYVYDPATGAVVDGVQGPGICMMTTDCLPAELPKESSAAFTSALLPFVPALARADFGGTLEAAGLPAPMRTAAILWKGALTPAYRYLEDHLAQASGG